ncbi:hypothetical protein AJ80_10106 [Polytolypa hystricis UAMH7299]|uniref:Uncharacterized protein n=1 Tax=Polytolypa hystricis (strain UAMH7299) TaxID=1447883 RepID=A0A2B7WE74_POLH7|nr:hypothetical protein AJ80_10106 [Polytolypa hystricis UAMH7299]
MPEEPVAASTTEAVSDLADRPYSPVSAGSSSPQSVLSINEAPETYESSSSHNRRFVLLRSDWRRMNSHDMFLLREDLLYSLVRVARSLRLLEEEARRTAQEGNCGNL